MVQKRTVFEEDYDKKQIFNKVKEESVSFSFESRYYTEGVETSLADQLWMCCHGYGQLAGFFIRHFQKISKEEGVRIVAPEGFHRFYLAGTEGRVGASWMTKEDRLRDIRNYITGLKAIYKRERLTNPEIPLTLLGFSQGASTISRLAMDPEIHFDRVILWAGVFPPDVPLELGKERLKGKELFFVYGTEDEYITPGRVEEIKSLLEKAGINFRIFTFEGGHTLDQALLDEIVKIPFSQ